MGCCSSKKKGILLPEPEIIAGHLILSGLKKKSFGKGRWYLKIQAVKPKKEVEGVVEGENEGEAAAEPEPEIVENFQTETKHADVRNNMIDWDEVFRIFVPDGKETELEIKFQLI